eukprot:8639353-Alexandrium_andersonii.AAC.1
MHELRPHATFGPRRRGRSRRRSMNVPSVSPIAGGAVASPAAPPVAGPPAPPASGEEFPPQPPRAVFGGLLCLPPKRMWYDLTGAPEEWIP